MKTILLTGAAGFIGSHVLEALVKRGDEVIAIDALYRLNEAVDDVLYNIRDVRANVGANFNMHIVDVRDGEKIEKILAEKKVDVVVHLAGLAGVRQSVQSPDAYMDVNVTGTHTMLQACLHMNVSKFIFASSSSVYGDNQAEIFSEPLPCRPLSPYAASKASAETICYTYRKCYGIQTTCLRFFTAYGPRNRRDMMAYKIVDNALRADAQPLVLYNNGQMRRDWTFVGDIVEGIISAIDSTVVGPINLGSNSPIMLHDFVQEVMKQTGRTVSYTSIPAPVTDVESTYASIQLAQRMLGWTPKTSINDGIARLIAWYKTLNF